jgi:hypothetical protein
VKALVLASVLVVLVAGRASADELKAFAGKLVISPDAPPTESSELPKYIRANLTKDATYPIVKGPPWSMHIVAVLAKDVKSVTLTIGEKGSKEPLVSTELVPVRRVVIAHTEATIAAGFANNKTYDVRLVSGKTVLAKAQLEIRD